MLSSRRSGLDFMPSGIRCKALTTILHQSTIPPSDARYDTYYREHLLGTLQVTYLVTNTRSKTHRSHVRQCMRRLSTDTRSRHQISTASRTLRGNSLSLSISLSLSLYIYIYLSLSLSLHMYIYIHVLCMYNIYIYIYIYIYILYTYIQNIYIYIYIYIYTHILYVCSCS